MKSVCEQEAVPRMQGFMFHVEFLMLHAKGGFWQEKADTLSLF
jgi:hypothetical protein